ncbi:unnamed protein product [uncultured bacterium]|nr:unnamed protein product [uncultured bacterium]
MKTEQPAGPVRLSVNTIVDGRWFAAGEALPYKDAAAVPPALQPFIVTDPDEPEPGPHRLNFEVGQVYRTDPTGAIITRHGQRQAARMAAGIAMEEAAEAAAIEAARLDAETAQILQEKHDVAIAYEIRAAEVAQARRDADEAVARAGEPAKPSERFVKRGAVFMHAGKAKLRPGEQVFAKEPSGAWAVVGPTDINGALPPDEVII